MKVRLLLLLPLLAAGPLVPAAAAQTAPATDLDAFMARALEHRATAWKTMEQYILNEREQFELRGPLGIPLFGERRLYTWFVRDGYFVRSPLEFNGVRIGDAERREYEEDWMHRELAREKRLEEKRAKEAAEKAGQSPETASAADTGTVPAVDAPPADVDAFLKQTSEPRFISAAYFLDFKFEPGNYYFAGRETLGGRPVVKVEYFPRALFRDEDDKPDDDDEDQRIQDAMNKVARVTLWVDEEQAMILKYVFENVDFDFLPGRWLVRVDNVRAEMQMAQPFPGIWLPGDMRMDFSMTLANGSYDFRYGLSFEDYRMGNVTSRIRFDRRVP